MATVSETTEQGRQRIQSILTAIKRIEERPEVLEDGSDAPWPIDVLKDVDTSLWGILEAADD